MSLLDFCKHVGCLILACTLASCSITAGSACLGKCPDTRRAIELDFSSPPNDRITNLVKAKLAKSNKIALNSTAISSAKIVVSTKTESATCLSYDYHAGRASYLLVLLSKRRMTSKDNYEFLDTTSCPLSVENAEERCSEIIAEKIEKM